MKLTVVIPVYNGSANIERCLDSVINQTYMDFRVLLFDDGSRDNSVAVIERFIRNHPENHLSLICQDNMGAAETRNRGIEEADTEYVAFIDQDDYISQTYFETYVTAMEQSKVDIVCGGYVRYSVDKQRALRTVSLDDNPWAKFVVVGPWAHLYRTDYLIRNKIRFLKTGIGEDVYFSLMAYANTDQILTIPDTGYFWVDNPVSVSNSRQKKVNKLADPFVLLNALVDNLPKQSKVPESYIEYFIYRYIVWYLLFTVRDTSRQLVESQYQRLISWLVTHYPNFVHNPLISLFGPKGEPFFIRVAVWGFRLLYKTHLVLPFLKFLANRERRENVTRGEGNEH